MINRNKLYKHHKSKVGLVMRNFSIAVASFAAFIILASIPTYISTNNLKEADATEIQEVKLVSDVDHDIVESIKNPTKF